MEPRFLISRNGERRRIGNLIRLQLLCSDIMLQEKTARKMYVKNREKMIQHDRRFYIVNFYNNQDVKINDQVDKRAEFYFYIPYALEILDSKFTEALTNYLICGKN